MIGDLEIITEEVVKWGIEVLRVEQFPQGIYIQHPPNGWRSWFGIDWQRGRIYHRMPDPQSFSNEDSYHVFPCMLIHEAAHVMMPRAPYHTDEIRSGMLWIEYLTLRRRGLGGLWDVWMQDYGLGEFASCLDWGSSCESSRQAALKASRKAALKRGLIRKNGHLSYCLPASVQQRMERSRKWKTT